MPDVTTFLLYDINEMLHLFLRKHVASRERHYTDLAPPLEYAWYHSQDAHQRHRAHDMHFMKVER